MNEEEMVTEPLEEVAKFLIEYVLKMLAYGATTIRIEKNVERIAVRYGVKADVMILPMHVMMTIWDRNHKNFYTMTEKIGSVGVDFDKNTLLSKLSWEIYDTGISLAEAKRKFSEITGKCRLNPLAVLLLTGLANASFCRIFGGDLISMVIVFVATITGFYLKDKLHGERQWDLRLVTIVSAFVATVIAGFGYVFGLGDTPDVALATGVLFLVPGVPFLNSMSDLIQGHYVCGISRFLQASLITICMSIGMCVGYLVVNIHIG